MICSSLLLPIALTGSDRVTQLSSPHHLSPPPGSLSQAWGGHSQAKFHFPWIAPPAFFFSSILKILSQDFLLITLPPVSWRKKKYKSGAGRSARTCREERWGRKAGRKVTADGWAGAGLLCTGAWGSRGVGAWAPSPGGGEEQHPIRRNCWAAGRWMERKWSSLCQRGEHVSISPRDDGRTAAAHEEQHRAGGRGGLHTCHMGGWQSQGEPSFTNVISTASPRTPWDVSLTSDFKFHVNGDLMLPMQKRISYTGSTTLFFHSGRLVLLSTLISPWSQILICFLYSPIN